MSLDFDTLQAQRCQHPAWRLLQADSAALVASFLHRAFVLPNQRVTSQSDLGETLEDTFYALRQQRGAAVYPKGALEYLNDWAANDKAWLRKFYPPGTDEPHFDLTPATERALAWLQTRPGLKISGAASRKAHPSHHCWPICTLRRFVLGWKKLGLERAQPLTLFAPATGAEALARHARPVGRWCALSRFVHGVDHHHGVFRHLHVSLPFVAGKRQQRLIVLLVARSARLRA